MPTFFFQMRITFFPVIVWADELKSIFKWVVNELYTFLYCIKDYRFERYSGYNYLKIIIININLSTFYTFYKILSKFRRLNITYDK